MNAAEHFKDEQTRAFAKIVEAAGEEEIVLQNGLALA